MKLSTSSIAPALRRRVPQHRRCHADDQEHRQEEQHRDLEHRPRLDVAHDPADLAGPHLRSLGRLFGASESGSSRNRRRGGRPCRRAGLAAGRVRAGGAFVSVSGRSRARHLARLGGIDLLHSRRERGRAPGVARPWARRHGLVGGHQGECRAAPFARPEHASAVAAGLGLGAGVTERDHHPHVEALSSPSDQLGAVLGRHLAGRVLALRGARQRRRVGRVAGRRSLLGGPRQRHRAPAAPPPRPPPAPARSARPARARPGTSWHARISTSPDLGAAAPGSPEGEVAVDATRCRRRPKGPARPTRRSPPHRGS